MSARQAPSKNAPWLIAILLAILPACVPIPILTATPSPTSTPLQPSPSATLTLSPTPTLTATPACTGWLGQVQEIELDTTLTYDPVRFNVYLPPCYALHPDERYPVLYLFHGLFYSNDQWSRLGLVTISSQLMASSQIPPFIIVLPYDPNGREPSATAFDEVFIQEIVPYLDEHYLTINSPSSRAVGGLSRGAGWAIHFGLTHPDSFGIIGAHSPIIFWEDDKLISAWLDAIPRADMPRIYLDIGDRDSNPESAHSLEALLNGKRIPHSWQINPGLHNEQYWSSQVEAYLRWYSAEW